MDRFIQESWKKYADLFIRIPIGFHLLYGVVDNIVSWDRMLEFEVFLESQGTPFPLIGALVSVYAQAIAGILYIIGYKTRWAAAVMIINFVVAILLVHLQDPYPNKFPAIMMLCGSIYLLIAGAGKISIDHWIQKKMN